MIIKLVQWVSHFRQRQIHFLRPQESGPLVYFSQSIPPYTGWVTLSKCTTCLNSPTLLTKFFRQTIRRRVVLLAYYGVHCTGSSLWILLLPLTVWGCLLRWIFILLAGNFAVEFFIVFKLFLAGRHHAKPHYCGNKITGTYENGYKPHWAISPPISGRCHKWELYGNWGNV